MSTNKSSACEVPAQERPKVTYSYLIDQPSRIFLTNDKEYYEGLVENYETFYMFGPEVNLINNEDEQAYLNLLHPVYLVQILLDKQGNLLKKTNQCEASSGEETLNKKVKKLQEKVAELEKQIQTQCEETKEALAFLFDRTEYKSLIRKGKLEWPVAVTRALKKYLYEVTD